MKFLAFLMLLAAGPAIAADHADARRIASLGGTVTEILYALGAGDRIAAVDSTSVYPEAARGKPVVGYKRLLSAEGVLSTRPDLIIAEADSGPADAMAVLEASGVPLVRIPVAHDVPSAVARIRAVGAAVGEDEAAGRLAARLDADLDALARDVAAAGPSGKRVLFALSLAGGRVMAGGRDTEADAIIRLAGGVNAAAAITGYKPLSDEAVIAAAPDLVLVMQAGGHALAADQVFALPAMAATPAAANRALVSMDALYLLGLGPRMAAAGRELARELSPGLVPAATAEAAP